MVDEVAAQQDGSIDAAAAAIASLLNPPKEPEPAKEEPKEPAPAEEAPKQAAQAAEETSDEVAAKAEEPAEETPQGKEEPQDVTEAPEAEKPKEAERPAPKPNTPQNPNINALSQRVATLQAQLQLEFPDVKSFDDLRRLAAEDPGRVAAFNVLTAELRATSEQLDSAKKQSLDEWSAAEYQKLVKVLPAVADPEKGPKLKADLTKYAEKLGYSEQQLSMASASDVVILHKAMLYDKSVAKAAADAKQQKDAIAQAKAKAAKAPPVQTPGTAPAAPNKDESKKEDFARLRKTGKLEDAAQVFKHFL